MNVQPHYRHFVLGVFFVFLLLHQADRLVIGQVLQDLQREFGIDDAAAGAIGTGALVVAAIFYLLNSLTHSGKSDNSGEYLCADPKNEPPGVEIPGLGCFVDPLAIWLTLYGAYYSFGSALRTR